jgi:hypothetical protein
MRPNARRLSIAAGLTAVHRQQKSWAKSNKKKSKTKAMRQKLLVFRAIAVLKEPTMEELSIVAATGDYHALVKACEEYELDACNLDEPTHLYGMHLMAYLLADDLNNARHCWRRIPSTTKTSTPELVSIWSIGQSLWKRQVFLFCVKTLSYVCLSTETMLQHSRPWERSSGSLKLLL